MPVTPAQLLAGANYQLQSYAKDDPVDQFSVDRPFAKWLIANKVDTVFGNGIYNEKIRVSNDSNYQNYSGDDQVTYN
ncbi:MAG: phage major capsid protein, partial [Rhodanobacteraceae bacterium]